jgi:hypothetical protein
MGQTYQQPFVLREAVYLSGHYGLPSEPAQPRHEPKWVNEGWLTSAARASARRRGEKR